MTQKRAKKPSPMVELTAHGLAPMYPADEELLSAFKLGQMFDLVPREKPRSLPQLRLYWAVLEVVAEATGLWPRAETLHDFLVRKCGYVRMALNPFTGEEEEIRDSIAFDALTHDDMNAYCDAALAALSTWLEIDVVTLLPPKKRGKAVLQHIPDEDLHVLARSEAARLVDPDHKQLRFNEIVDAAKAFYPANVDGGVREMIESCDRANPSLYVKAQPMWKALQAKYAWMIA